MEDRTRLVAVLEQARERGAKAAEVLRARRSVLELTGSRARPEQRLELEWIVRLWLEGGRAGIGVGVTPGNAVDMAASKADKAPLDPLAGPAERMVIRTGALGIDDHRHPAIADEDRGEVLSYAERAFSQGGLRVRHLRYRQVREERAWMSTRGVEAAEAATEYVVSAEVFAGDAGVTGTIASRHFSDVASLPFGPELRRRVEPLARSASAPPSGLPLVLEPRVMAELARALAPAFAADRADRSFLGPFRGKRLAAGLLHFTDDAGLFGGLRTRGFDDRGVPPIAVTLLKEGIVHGLYHDPETARAVGLRPTGHVSRGALVPSNLIVRPGSRTRNVILAELGTYLLLDRFPGIDLATGRIDAVVPLVLVDRGERVGAVRMRMALGIADLLAAAREVAADQERSAEVDTPTGVFDGTVLTPI